MLYSGKRWPTSAPLLIFNLFPASLDLEPFSSSLTSFPTESCNSSRTSIYSYIPIWILLSTRFDNILPLNVNDLTIRSPFVRFLQ